MNATPDLSRRATLVTVRLNRDTHYQLRIAAARRGMKIEHLLNQLVLDGLKQEAAS